MNYFFTNLKSRIQIICTIIISITLLSGFDKKITAADLNKDIQMMSEYIALQEYIVVSASKREQRMIDAPLSVTVITSEDIKMSGAQSLPDVLRIAPGLNVEQITGSQYEIGIRSGLNIPAEQGSYNGFSFKYLVLIDGRSFFNEVTGIIMWSGLPVTIDTIDRIEIVRGPASALYGANAVCGVINIITKKNNISEPNSITAFHGTDGHNRLNFSVTTVKDKLSMNFSGEYSGKNVFNKDGFDFVDNEWKNDRMYLNADGSKNSDMAGIADNSEDLKKAIFKGTYTFSNISLLDINASYARLKANIYGPGGDILILNFKNIEENSIRLNYTYKNYSIKLSKIDGLIGETDGDNAADLSKQRGASWESIDLDAQSNWQTGENNILTAGINLRNLDSRSFRFFNQVDKINQRFNAIFLHNTYSFSEQWKLVTSARYDNFSYPDKDMFSPQVILNYRPADNKTLRFNYSQASRVPFLIETTLNSPTSLSPGQPSIFNWRGDNTLNPTKVKSYEISYMSEISDKINFSIGGFFSKMDKLIGYKNTYSDSISVALLGAAAADLQYQNLNGDLNTIGMEASVNFIINKWKGFFSYSLKSEKVGGQGTIAAPRHTASAGMSKKFQNKWYVSGSINYVSSLDFTLTSLADYTMGAKISRDIVNPGSQLAVDAAAIYDQISRMYGGPTKTYVDFITEYGKYASGQVYDPLSMAAFRGAVGEMLKRSSSMQVQAKSKGYAILMCKVGKELWTNCDLSINAKIAPKHREHPFGEELQSNYSAEIKISF